VTIIERIEVDGVVSVRWHYDVDGYLGERTVYGRYMCEIMDCPSTGGCREYDADTETCDCMKYFVDRQIKAFERIADKPVVRARTWSELMKVSDELLVDMKAMSRYV